MMKHDQEQVIGHRQDGSESRTYAHANASTTEGSQRVGRTCQNRYDLSVPDVRSIS